MAKKVKVFINRPELTEIMNECAREICEPLATDISLACGVGYESDLHDFRGGRRSRSVASVYTETPEAMVDNMKNNTILRNLQ